MPRPSLLQTTALAQPSALDPYLKAGTVADRYDSDLRTINVWIASGTLPPPDLIRGGKRFWRQSTLEKADRQVMANAMTKFSGRPKYPRGSKKDRKPETEEEAVE